MANSRAGFDGRKGVDGWGGEEEDVAVLVLLEAVADFFGDELIRVLWEAIDLRWTWVGAALRWSVSALRSREVVMCLGVGVWRLLSVLVRVVDRGWRSRVLMVL